MATDSTTTPSVEAAVDRVVEVMGHGPQCWEKNGRDHPRKAADCLCSSAAEAWAIASAARAEAEQRAGSAVYIVGKRDWEDWDVIGVFTSEDEAEKCRSAHQAADKSDPPYGWSIERHPIQTAWPNGQPYQGTSTGASDTAR